MIDHDFWIDSDGCMHVGSPPGRCVGPSPARGRVIAGAAFLAVLVGLALGVIVPAQAATGRGLVYKTTALGGSPASYRLVVSETEDVTVGDHVIAYTATSSGVWEVTAKDDDDLTLDVQELLTEEHGSAFGAPAATAPRNVYGFSSPGANSLTLLPDSSVPYAAAALRRNALLSVGSASVTTAVQGCIAVFDGTTWTLIPPGADGKTLTTDSTAPGGLKWQ